MKRKISILFTLLLCWLAPFLRAPALAYSRLEHHSAPAPGADSAAVQAGAYFFYLPVIYREYNFSATGLGPYLGRVLGMGQDPSNPANLYAMTYGSGMYKSTNYGASWSPASVGITNLTLQSMAVDPVNPNTVYAGAYGDAAVPYNGVYKSTNGGLTWSATGEMANVWNGVRYNVPIIYALAVDPLHPNRVFAGTRMRYLPNGSLGGGGVFRSENGGASWAPVNSGLPGVDLYIYDVYVDPAHPGVVYAALHQHGLYRSDNYGNSWYPLNGTPYAGRAVTVDPYLPNTIFFGAVKKLGLNRSTNYGANWSRVGSEGWDVAVGAISPDPYHTGKVFAGILSNNTDYHLMRSDDHGNSWTSTGSLNIWGRMVFSPDGRTEYVGVDFDGPYKSIDGGWSWFPSKQGFSGFSVTGLAVSPASPGTLYAALYGYGVHKSTNRGGTWLPASAGLDSTTVYALAIDPANPAVVYATTVSSAVYRTTNGGASWAALAGGYPAAGPALTDPGDPAGSLVLPAPYSPFVNRLLPELEGLKDQSDAPLDRAGAARTGAPSALSAATGRAAGNTIAVSPFNSSVVLVGTAGRGIYRLSGSSWAATNRITGTVYHLLFDRSTPGRALAGTDAVSGSLLVTTDNGQSWQPFNTGLSGRAVYSLAQSAANPLVLLAGTDSGVYQSADGGATWTQAGLNGLAVKAVNLMPGAGNLYLAGTETTAYYGYAATNEWKLLGSSFDNIGIQGIAQSPGSQAFYFFTRLGGVVRLEQVP